MKDSKLKIILPIILTPIFLILLSSYIGIHEARDFKTHKGINDPITQDEVEEYLQSKNDGDFTNLTLINHTEEPATYDPQSCERNSDYTNSFLSYYTAYSQKYDTEFLILAKRITPYKCNSTHREISDDLDYAKNNKRKLEIVDRVLSQYNYTFSEEYKYFYSLKSFDVDITIKINDDFNTEYYNKLLSLNELLANEEKKLHEEGLNDSIGSIYFIFNDVTFTYYISSMYIDNRIRL